MITVINNNRHIPFKLLISKKLKLLEMNIASNLKFAHEL